MDRVSTLVAYLDIHPSDVSIPRSGWIVFQLSAVQVACNVIRFQSLVRDGSCFNPRPMQE